MSPSLWEWGQQAAFPQALQVTLSRLGTAVGDLSGLPWASTQKSLTQTLSWGPAQPRLLQDHSTLFNHQDWNNQESTHLTFLQRTQLDPPEAASFGTISFPLLLFPNLSGTELIKFRGRNRSKPLFHTNELPSLSSSFCPVRWVSPCHSFTQLDPPCGRQHSPRGRAQGL